MVKIPTIALGALAVGLAGLAGWLAHPTETPALAFADGRLVDLDATALTQLPPANAGDIRALASRSADSVIGYYDKGYNFHAQHMKVTPRVMEYVDPSKIEGKDVSRIEMAAQ